MLSDFEHVVQLLLIKHIFLIYAFGATPYHVPLKYRCPIKISIRIRHVYLRLPNLQHPSATNLIFEIVCLCDIARREYLHSKNQHPKSKPWIRITLHLISLERWGHYCIRCTSHPSTIKSWPPIRLWPIHLKWLGQQ